MDKDFAEYIEERLARLHKLSFDNEDIIKQHRETVCCFHCHAEHYYADFQNDVKWITERSGKRTAVCPSCEVDALLPIGVLDRAMVDIMHKKYFGIAENNTKS